MTVPGNQKPDTPGWGPAPGPPGGPVVVPQGASGNCGCKGKPESAAAPTFVYALGRVEPRFLSPSVEKEFAQATGRGGAAGLTDRQALHAVLARRENRYLVRQLCWVLTVEGLETSLLLPGDPADHDLLVEALRPAPRLDDV